MMKRLLQMIVVLILASGCGSGGNGVEFSPAFANPPGSEPSDLVGEALVASPGAVEFLSRQSPSGIYIDSDRALGENRFLVFTSAEDLVPTDTNGHSDVYLRDLRKGEMRVVSVSSSGAEGNGDSDQGSISADGRYVAFRSAASNLVDDDTNELDDIFLHEVPTGKTFRVSTNSADAESDGESLTPAVSARGRYVVFGSTATNLAANDTNGVQDIFIKDRETGDTVLISSNASGNDSADGPSSQPAISGGTVDEGEFVAFCTEAKNILSNPLDGQRQIVRVERDSLSSRILISRDSAGNPADGPCYSPSISDDASMVGFFTLAGNLGAQPDTNNLFDVYQHDVALGTTEIRSVGTTNAPGNDHSGFPSLSADGETVAFGSLASNLVVDDNNNRFDVFTRTNNATSLASRSTAGIPGSDDSGLPSLSASGRYVAFRSAATNFDLLDNSPEFDIYVRDSLAPNTFWASLRCLFSALWPGTDGIPAISADDLRRVHFADVDGDGDLDLLHLNRDIDSLSVSINVDGRGSFIQRGEYPTPATPNTFDVGDIDGDGDIDVVIQSQFGSAVAVLYNEDARGTFSAPDVLDIGPDLPYFVALGDYDGDRDLDIAVSKAFSLDILFNQDGRGDFSTPVSIGISPGQFFARFLVTGDFDGDKDLDIVASDTTFNEVFLFENTDGDGTFTLLSRLDPPSSSIVAADLGDVDGDRDLDLIVGTSLSSRIVLYLNSDGEGTYVETELATNLRSSSQVRFGDVDSDDDLDIVFLEGDSNGSSVAVMKNDGDGNFDSSLNFGSITGGFVGIPDLGDVDGDGDLDIGIGLRFAGAATVVENTEGTGDYTRPVREFPIGSDLQTLQSADMDGDGDMDLVVGEFSPGRISVFTNSDGAATYTGPTSYSTGLAIYSVELEDIDSDGDLDVLVADAESDSVTILTNSDGRGTLSVGSSLRVDDRPFSAIFADLDGDGDNDIATANANAGTVSVLFNSDGAGDYRGRRDFPAGNNPNDIRADDVDGDGDLDLVVNDFDSGRVVVLTNSDGTGDFSETTELTVGSNPRSLDLGDLDTDGDLDLVVVDFTTNELVVFSNSAGSFVEIDRRTTGSEPRSVRLGDVDGDGHLDAVVANSADSHFSVFFNSDGDGVFDSATGYATEAGPFFVTLSDVDSDGDLDFLSANREGQSVSLLRNQSCP